MMSQHNADLIRELEAARADAEQLRAELDKALDALKAEEHRAIKNGVRAVKAEALASNGWQT